MAYKWYTLGDARGAAEARVIRDAMAAWMAPAQIAEAQKLAQEWWKSTTP